MPTPVELLDAATPSLARRLPAAPRGTLFVLGPRGGLRVARDSGFTVLFGRNEPEVHVALGSGDGGVSRRQGAIARRGASWTVRNDGRLPLRLPGAQLVLAGHEEELPDGYTPIFVRTGARREHLLEVRVAERADESGRAGDAEVTAGPHVWPLSDRERLALVVLGQRYLRHDRDPQPVSWKAAAEELRELQPEQRWSAKQAEHVVSAVRARLARSVPGLTREEVGEPVGNVLNHRLLVELLSTATLVPPDLVLLEEAVRAAPG